MKEFEYYITLGEVKIISKDKELAKSLLIDAEERISMVMKLDKKIFTKIVYESIYDGLRAFCDSLLALQGYKSYSHQASISFLKKYGVNNLTIEKLDLCREIRNASKYYGKNIFVEDLYEIEKLYNELKEKIKEVKNLLK